MAMLVYTDAFVHIDGLDLSDHVKSITLNYEAEILDNTAMGTTGTRSNIAGLKNWTLDVEFFQDFVDGSVDSKLFHLIGHVPFAIRIRPSKTSAISVNNPEYQGNAVLASYPPVTGEVGALGMCAATFRCASDLVRDVTP